MRRIKNSCQTVVIQWLYSGYTVVIQWSNNDTEKKTSLMRVLGIDLDFCMRIKNQNREIFSYGLNKIFS